MLGGGISTGRRGAFKGRNGTKPCKTSKKKKNFDPRNMAPMKVLGDSHGFFGGGDRRKKRGK